MAKTSGLRQKRFHAINANPVKGTTYEELYEATGLDEGKQAPVGSPLTVNFNYRGESIILKPGDFIELRESEANSFRRAIKEQGCIVVPVDCDELESMEATLKVWRERQTYYREKGIAYARELMMQAERPLDQLEGVYKFTYFPYFMNERLAEILTAEIKGLVKEIKNHKKGAALRDAKAAKSEEAAA